MLKPAALALSLAFAAPAVAATPPRDESVKPPTGDFVSVHAGKAAIKRLGRKVAVRDGASSYLVFACRHPGRRSDTVACTVRLRFVDARDGVAGYTRYDGVATARRTTLTPR